MARQADPEIHPGILAAWMAPFAGCFTRPTWANLLKLVAGTILSPGRRTVAAALSSLGLRGAATFTNYHRVLNRSRWSGQAAARCLLGLLVAAFAPSGPVVIGVKPRGGLSKRYAQAQGCRHKLLTDRARQLLLLLARWLPERQVIAVADSSYAAIELPAVMCQHVTVITRLRLDARLFEPPLRRRPGTKRRSRVSGAPQPTLLHRLADPNTTWQRVTVTGWYGQGERQPDIVSATALWYHPGKQVPIRWVLVRDAAGEFEPQAFLCTDQDAGLLDVLRCFARRWSVEVTFAEVRRHRGVETQRQWSDLAIAHTTPCLLALFSLVALRATGLATRGLVQPRRAAWYAKPQITFSDALAAVRKKLWSAQAFSTSAPDRDMVEIPTAFLDRLTKIACHPA